MYKIFGDDDDRAETLYTDKLWEIGGDNQAFALVFQGPNPECWGDNKPCDTWLTRFDSWTNSSANTKDPVFALDGGTKGLVIQTEIVRYEDESDREKAERRAGLAFLLVPLGIGIGLRRRRKSIRQ